MVWKVRADCTYTTTNNKQAREADVQSVINSYPTAIIPNYADELGRFSGGLTSQSSTRFTVSYDFDDTEGDVAGAFASDLHSALASSAKSTTMVSVHHAKGF